MIIILLNKNTKKIATLEYKNNEIKLDFISKTYFRFPTSRESKLLNNINVINNYLKFTDDPDIVEAIKKISCEYGEFAEPWIAIFNKNNVRYEMLLENGKCYKWRTSLIKDVENSEIMDWDTNELRRAIYSIKKGKEILCY